MRNGTIQSLVATFWGSGLFIALVGCDPIVDGQFLASTEALAPVEAHTATLTLTMLDSAPAGQALDITVQVMDPHQKPLPDYTGTISFSSTDTLAQLPTPITLTAEDGGSKTLRSAVIMQTSGVSQISARDLNNVTGTTSVRVNAPPFMSMLANRCIDTIGQATAAGSLVVVADCDGAATQQWDVQNGHLRNAMGQCLDDQGGPAGTQLAVAPCDPKALGQQWSYDSARHKLVKSDQSNTCVDLSHGAVAAGTPIITAECHADIAPSQVWLRGAQFSLNPVDQSALCLTGTRLSSCDGTLAQQWFYIGGQLRASTSGLCLDVNAADGAALLLSPCSGAMTENWTYDLATSRFVSAIHPDKCIESADETIVLQDCRGSTDPNLSQQQWLRNGGAVRPSTDLTSCLSASTLSAGSNVQMVTCDGTASQQWEFVNAVMRLPGQMCLTAQVPDAVLTPCDDTAANPNQVWLYDEVTHTINAGDSAAPTCLAWINGQVFAQRCDGSVYQSWYHP